MTQCSFMSFECVIPSYIARWQYFSMEKVWLCGQSTVKGVDGKAVGKSHFYFQIHLFKGQCSVQ